MSLTVIARKGTRKEIKNAQSLKQNGTEEKSIAGL